MLSAEKYKVEVKVEDKDEDEVKVKDKQPSVVRNQLSALVRS